MEPWDLVIIGGGPAGLAAAEAARAGGVESGAVLERDAVLGGVLNQCLHRGFGLPTFGEELTGPEYARRWIRRVQARDVSCKVNTMVLELAPDRTLTAMSPQEGLFRLRPRAVILAMGCRERPRGALNIPGYRPAGVYTAGAAQRLIHADGVLPGREVVILGSGDIGLTTARRMTLAGARIHAVVELLPYSRALKRNLEECLEAFHIPLLLRHTVVDIQGKRRVEGVTVAQVDERGKPMPGSERHLPCDTLLLSVGLIPENELTRRAGAAMDPATRGPLVDARLETSLPGVFACGNVLHIHPTVDDVSREGALAGREAARFLLARP